MPPQLQRLVMATVLLAGVCLLGRSTPTEAIPQAPAQSRAGQVVRLVPAVHLERPGEASKAAGPQMPVHWLDVVKTERLARARVRLDDGSVLNIGAESVVTIQQRDAALQRTELEMEYGRMRSKVVKAARQGSGFRVRTPVAVAGVVGTEFWIGVVQDYTDVLCLEGLVEVKNSDDRVPGTVVLRAGEFTRVMRGQPPLPPVKAPPEKLKQAVEETEVPVPVLAGSRAEVSWPPSQCGTGVNLMVRVWEKKKGLDGKETESPVEPDLIAGTLAMGSATLKVEDGFARLVGAPTAAVPTGTFTPAGADKPVETRIWEPRPFATGDGWRAPRAVFGGSAFNVLGPMGAGAPSFTFGAVPAGLLWSGPCGAGFLAPVGPTAEHTVTLSVAGRPVAHGKMNLVGYTTRLPMPPTTLRGQTTNFGVDLRGLENLGAATEGRPIMTVVITNRTVAILGNLKGTTRGAISTGLSITYLVSALNVDPTGIARLDGSGRGLQSGQFVLGVDFKLDSALDEPRTPMKPLP